MTLRTYQAFVDDFRTQAFGLPVAHENDDFTPTPGTAWVRLRFFENEVTPVGHTSIDDETGLFQFTLHYPLDEGAIPARTMADTILSAYPPRRLFSYSGQQVEVTGALIFDASPVDGWYQIVGRVNYRAFV